MGEDAVESLNASNGPEGYPWRAHKAFPHRPIESVGADSIPHNGLLAKAVAWAPNIFLRIRNPDSKSRRCVALLPIRVYFVSFVSLSRVAIREIREKVRA